MGWIRTRMDQELLPGAGSGTLKIQSWIRIWNKSFRIRNTVKIYNALLRSRAFLAGAGAEFCNFDLLQSLIKLLKTPEPKFIILAFYIL